MSMDRSASRNHPELGLDSSTLSNGDTENPMVMRRQFALLLPLLLATCAAPKQWKKAGVGVATTAQDTSDCRAAARDDVLRRYPNAFSGSPSLGAGGMVVSQHRDDTHRSAVEAASFNSCMQAKGYAPSSSP